jgi:transcriptional regulator with XRE-family HTH domain
MRIVEGKGYRLSMTVNKRIKEVRKALKMPQPLFAKAIYISKGYIAELENEHRKANDRIIHLIALTFGVSETYLKTGEGDMFNKAPTDKKEQILRLFDELNPQFQDYVLHVVSQLIKMQQEQRTFGLRDSIPE